MIILGIDLSSSSTGLALVGDDDSLRTVAVRPKGKRGRDRFRAIMSAIEETIQYEGVDVVGIENPAHNASSGAKDVVYGFWWYATQIIHESGVPWYRVMPSSRAKYLTGSGRASKAEALRAASERAGRLLGTDDEADAAAIAWMGLEALSGASVSGVKWEVKYEHVG